MSFRSCHPSDTGERRFLFVSRWASLRSVAKYVFCMPRQCSLARTGTGIVGHLGEGNSVVWVVAPAIAPFFPQSGGHPDHVLGRHSHVALVEERVELLGKQQTVLNVLPTEP